MLNTVCAVWACREILAGTNRPPDSRLLVPANDLTRQFDSGLCWETFVCSQELGDCSPEGISLAKPVPLVLTVASRHCVKPKINGPLQYVNSAKVGEEKQGWGNPGNETVLRSVLDASVPVGRELTRTYFSRTNEQTIPKTLNPIRMACVLRIL